MEISVRCGGNPCAGQPAYIYRNNLGEMCFTTQVRYNHTEIGYFKDGGKRNGFAKIILTKKLFNEVCLEDGRVVTLEFGVKLLDSRGNYIEEDE